MGAEPPELEIMAKASERRAREAIKTTVGRTYRFRATHSLPDFPEPWRYPHEHDYTVEVEAVGGTDTDLLDVWWGRVGCLDGEAMDERFDPSTVENIAEQLCHSAPDPVLSVRVWEDKQRWGRAER